MSKLQLFVSISLLYLATSHAFVPTAGDSGGGVDCAACTIVVSIFEQWAEYNEKTFEQAMDEVCDLFPQQFESICTYFVNTYGGVIVSLLNQDFNSDEACHITQFCTDPTCRLWSDSPKMNLPDAATLAYIRAKIMFNLSKRDPQENPWDWLMALINRLANQHEPVYDVDGDDFSTMASLRGSNWRGKDCDDMDANIHPGRAVGSDDDIDWNCNGISGTDSHGKSYEETLCGTSQLGTIVLGDSAGAHFSIPPSYFNASQINSTTYSNLLDVISNEVDWPMRSGYTGWESSYHSIYHKLRARNLCNHRDYQNLGVNGARSGAMANGLVQTIARNQTLDHPALVFLELIGNDVCNGHHDLNTMTTPQEFATNILASLDYLDTVLPSGSHVVFVGLANGSVLFDALHNRKHPLGPTYEEVYDFLNCLSISPCWVWMNSNATVRAAGTARAMELSAVYPQIISNYSSKYTHFDMAYYDFPFEEIAKIWIQEGGQIWELIEPSDGFHPNQIANQLMADWFWTALSQDHPTFLGSVNSNNALITKLFGDQGGY